MFNSFSSTISVSCRQYRLLLSIACCLMMTVFVNGRATPTRRTTSTLFGSSSFASRRGVVTPSSYHVNVLNEIRGGSDFDDESEDEYDEYDSDVSDDEDDELLGDFDLMGEDDAGEDDFSEDTQFERLVEHYKKTPPLTKAYLTASFVVTSFAFLFNNKDFPPILLLSWDKVFKRGQIWRPLTAFLNFGPIGLGYALTLQFVWTYMGTLERLHHRKPFDFWIMICFGMLTMVAGYPILKVNPRFLGHNLSTFLVYVWSRYHEGLQVNLFELFTTRAEILPWFFLLQTFLLEGEPPILDFLGIVFGHVYYHCKTVGILRAPEGLVKWYKESDSAEGLRKKYKQISTEFEFI